MVASGTLIMALGPAFCSPLNGIGLVMSNPHGAASSGIIEPNPDGKSMGRR